MDQLKQQLAVVLQYGFWICAAIVFIGSLGIWYMTTTRLADENRSQESKLSSAVSSVSTLRGELDTQPNDLSHAAMQELIDARQEEVLASWQSLFERQQGLLTWPTDKLSPALTGPFIDKIPIEEHIPFPTTEEDELVEPYLRTQYQRYIGDALPDIAKIAKAEWSAAFDASGPMMGTMTDSASFRIGGSKRVDITGGQSGPLVKWQPSSQQELLDDLFPWRKSGDKPSSLEIYYSQENLWILKQMLQVIANVNGDAKQPYQAKIREIVRISIGESVEFTAGTISEVGASVTSGDLYGSMGGDYGDYGDMSDDMYGNDTGGGLSTAVQIDPADNRYVNAKNEPITGAALRSALTSTSPSDAEIAVAKRVPVMMSMQIDQRSIQQLLAECGSAPLMIQVSQVRVLPKDGISTIGGGSGGDYDSEMEDEYGSGQNGMMGASPAMMMQGAAAAKPADPFPFDMAVEVYGLINLYNPPIAAKLGLDQVDQNTVIEGVTGTESTQPAAAVPPSETNQVLPTPETNPPADPNATNPPADPDATEPPADPNATNPPADPNATEPPADPANAATPVAAAAGTNPPAMVTATP